MILDEVVGIYISILVKKAKINQNSLNVKFDESELKTPFFGLFWTEI